MKKVIAFGTFDIFHQGHMSYLSQASELGDYLIVVVARDKTVLRVKGQEPRNNEQKRLQVLNDTGSADEVILGSLADKYAVIEEHKPGVIALGYDQQVNLEELKNKLEKFGLQTEVVRLEAFEPEVYKSSKMKS